MLEVADDNDFAVRLEGSAFTPVVFGVIEVGQNNSATTKVCVSVS